MLEKLTKEQVAIMYQHRDEYIDFIVNNGKSCPDKLKIKDIKDDIDWIYEKAGLEPPKHIFIANSYLQEKLIIDYILKNGHIPSCLVSRRDEGTDILKNSLQTVISKMIRDLQFDMTDRDLAGMSSFGYTHIHGTLLSSDHLNAMQLANSSIKNDVSEKMAQMINNEMSIAKLSELLRNVVSIFVWHTVEKICYDEPLNTTTALTINISYMKELQQQQQQQQQKGGEKRKIIKFVEQGFGISWNVWYCFYAYFQKIGIVKNKDFERYYNFMKKGIWSIQFFQDWCICTQMPLKISRDSRNRLHSLEGSAVEWRDGGDISSFSSDHSTSTDLKDPSTLYIVERIHNMLKIIDDEMSSKLIEEGSQHACIFSMDIFGDRKALEWINSLTLKGMSNQIKTQIYKMIEESILFNDSNKRSKNHFIHGVAFTEELWEKIVTDKITVQEILNIENMEMRRTILSVIPPSRIIKDLTAKLVSTHKQKQKKNTNLKHKDIKLYSFNGSDLGLRENVYILFYTDPSTDREYFSFIDPANTKDAATAMASKFGLTKKEYINNLVMES